MNLPLFTLYGLIGCPHCSEAERYLSARRIPFLLHISNDDPIANGGVKAVTSKEEYPVLVSKLDTKNIEVIVGFKENEYERIVSLFYKSVSASILSIFAGEQPNQPAVAKTV